MAKTRNLDLEEGPKNLKRLRELIEEAKVKFKIEYDLKIEDEDIPVRGNAMASGDDAADKAAEDEILERLERGDVIAWCCIVVKARIVGARHAYEGVATLGCCSYLDEHALRRDAFEYYNLKAEALEDLVKGLYARLSIGAEAGAILKAIGGA